MRKESLRAIVLWSLAVGGGLLAICGVKDQVSKVIILPPIIYTILLVTGVILILVPIAIVSFSLIPGIRRRKLTTYEAVLAQKGDLEELHEFCEKHVGPHFATLESWRKRHEKHPGTFFMVKAITKKKFKKNETLAGAFTIIPVNEMARNLLEKDQLSANTFTTEHIASPSEKPAALYISGIVGSNFRAKGYALSLLISNLQMEKARGNHLLYTRPMTVDGLRLAKAKGFSPVNPTVSDQADCIYKIDMLDATSE